MVDIVTRATGGEEVIAKDIINEVEAHEKEEKLLESTQADKEAETQGLESANPITHLGSP